MPTKSKLQITTNDVVGRRLPRNRPPTHPGKMLFEEFVKPRNFTQIQLARRIDVSYPQLNEIRRSQAKPLMRRDIVKKGKFSFNGRNFLTPLGNILFSNSAHSTISIFQVRYLPGVNPHDSGAGGIDGREVSTHD